MEQSAIRSRVPIARPIAVALWPVLLSGLTATVSASDAAAPVAGASTLTPGPSVVPPAASVPEHGDAPPTLRLSVDGGIVLGSLILATASSAITVEPSLWRTQLLPFDSHLEGHLSRESARRSDMLLAVAATAPAALLVGQAFDRQTAKRLFIYGETLLANYAINTLVRALVARPRPYVYGGDPAAVEYTRMEGREAYQSFYSVHASTAFAASVAGATLFAQQTSDVGARATVWGLQMALAAATADLRTRAGHHFYSDVLVGGLAGAGMGIAIPALHGGARARLSRWEWLGIAAGLLAGVAVGELLPVSSAR